MIRLGLCCLFKKQPIRFRRTTAKHISKLSRSAQYQKLSEICLDNGKSLLRALTFCSRNAIGSFRINSQILPLKTHPETGYDIMDLPDAEQIVQLFKQCGSFSRENDIRTTFHPDQFLVLSSPRPEVVRRSLEELHYQAQVAQWVNADVINIHAGGVYGDKTETLKRLEIVIERLLPEIRNRLTFENDDRSYTPSDLISLSHNTGIPVVYDIHHHRCLTDDLTEAQATRLCAATWDREPLFHISSPRDGWHSENPRPHSEFIHPDDFPAIWKSMQLTVEVEAKAKEIAVLQLMKQIKEDN